MLAESTQSSAVQILALQRILSQQAVFIDLL
jgi:hypothetical protein